MDKRQINGATWIKNQSGDWVPAANYPSVKLQNAQMAEELVRDALAASARLAEFKTKAYECVYRQLIAMGDEYKAVVTDSKPINITSIDQRFRVDISFATYMVADEFVQVARAKMSEIIARELAVSSGISSFISAVFNKAFQVDKQGRMDVKKLFELAKYEAPEVEGWDEARQLLIHSISNSRGKKYIRFYYRDAADKWVLVPLQFSDL